VFPLTAADMEYLNFGNNRAVLLHELIPSISRVGEPCAPDFECARKSCIAESSRAGIPASGECHCIEVGNPSQGKQTHDCNHETL
jgi:hypothetical protein